MYLIYVSAKQEDQKSDVQPQQYTDHDLQPIMLALTRNQSNYFLREADTKSIDNPKPEKFADIERLFVRLRKCDDDTPKDSAKPDDEVEADSSNEEAQLAVALATVYFGKGGTEPLQEDFASYVRSRSRLADKLIVAGYTDDDCSMTKSEFLALSRAMSVRDLFLQEGIEIPVVAIARPKCCFAGKPKWSRRVEVTALFTKAGDDEDGDDDLDETGDGPSLINNDEKVKKNTPALVNRSRVLVHAMLLLVALSILPMAAMAGGGSSTEFDTVVTKLQQWATGGLGRAISLAAVIVGAMISVIRSNPMPILSGIAFAMILNFTPGIITALLSATI